MDRWPHRIWSVVAPAASVRLVPDTASVQAFSQYFKWNPFFHIAVSYQEVLFFHGPFVEGHMRSLLLMGAASVTLFLAGYWLFDRLRDSFAEAV